MNIGRWYRQDFRSTSEVLYFLPTSIQKNGGYAGILVTVDEARPRAKPRAKNSSVDRSWSTRWQSVSEAPPNVERALADRFPAIAMAKGVMSSRDRRLRRMRDPQTGPGGIPWPLSDRRWELLRDLKKPPIERRLPPAGDSVVYDRLYRELADEKYIYWHRNNENVSSLYDHYRLTVRGKAALDDYAMMARGVAGTRRRDTRSRRGRRI